MNKAILVRIRSMLAYEEARKARDEAYPTIQGWASSQFLEDEYLHNKESNKVLLPTLRLSRRNLKEVRS